jgi:hypothetical protein
MLKGITAILAVSGLVIASTAMAESPAQSGPSGAPGFPQRDLSWEQLRQACANPSAFQAQRAPQSIRVTCEDSRIVWEVQPAATLAIDNQRVVTSSLSSDKYNVARQQAAVNVPETVAMCPVLKEVQLSYTNTFDLTCAEIGTYKGNLNDFCTAHLDADIKGNAALAQRRDTGRSYDLCAAPAITATPKPVAPAQQPGFSGGKGRNIPLVGGIIGGKGK